MALSLLWTVCFRVVDAVKRMRVAWHLCRSWLQYQRQVDVTAIRMCKAERRGLT